MFKNYWALSFMGRRSSVSAFDQMVSTTIFPTAVFNITSTSYENLLNGNGGSPVQVTITKGDGSSLLVLASASLRNPNNASTLTLGVNDGTTDYDLARVRIDPPNSIARTAIGNRLITGLPAGTYTMTLRVKCAGLNSVFSGNEAASLSVMEVAS